MKNVIAGLEEGLNAIAEALEGGNIVPTPAAADEGKVLTAGDDGTASWEDAEGGLPAFTSPDDSGKMLKLIEQNQQGDLAPEWATPREVPAGGSNGQVLTKNSNGYGWAAPAGGLPSIDEGDSGKVLTSYYDSEEEYGYSRWDTIASVPGSSASDSGKVLTCTGKNRYGWAAASGGGHIDVLKFTIAKSEFTQDGSVYKAYINGSYPNLSTKIDNMISISIVDNVDSGSPTFTIPSNDDDCSIYMDGDDGRVSVSSSIYATLGTRQAINFYLTYYNA